MIRFDDDMKIFICRDKVDMRKSIDGLSLLVIDSLQLDPQDKALYLFHNKANDKFKAIFWDGNGFMLLYKRLEKGRLKFPKNIESDYYEIDQDLFSWLRKGYDFYAIKNEPELKASKYF
jgi:transposase